MIGEAQIIIPVKLVKPAHGELNGVLQVPDVFLLARYHRWTGDVVLNCKAHLEQEEGQ